jgi:hypothetical protein
MPVDVSVFLILIVLYIVQGYIFHQTDLAHAYSNPTIIISRGHRGWGNLKIYDDYREAYYWLK